MRESTFKCDICHIVRGSSNHWFIGQSGLKDVLRPGLVLNGAAVIAWDDQMLNDRPQTHIVHLCGIDCSLKFVARELAK